MREGEEKAGAKSAVVDALGIRSDGTLREGSFVVESVNGFACCKPRYMHVWPRQPSLLLRLACIVTQAAGVVPFCPRSSSCDHKAVKRHDSSNLKSRATLQEPSCRPMFPSQSAADAGTSLFVIAKEVKLRWHDDESQAATAMTRDFGTCDANSGLVSRFSF